MEEIDNLKVQLNSCVEIIENTLNDLNLQVVGYGVGDIYGDGWYDFMIEITSISNTSIQNNVEIKLNVYDQNNFIIANEYVSIYKEDFSGYDTQKFYLHSDNIAFNTQKIRIFAVKG